MKKEYLECGKICNAHGVRGLVKVESWCDSPAVLAKQRRVFFKQKDGSFTESRVISASQMQDMVLMNIEGISSREDAIALKNTLLYLHRSDIPVRPGAMLLQDMIGLPVINAADSRLLGHIKSVDDAVRGQMYTIETASGDVLLPAVPAFVKSIDPEVGVTVTPIPGFFEVADEI